jgi:hypothetical protein
MKYLKNLAIAAVAVMALMAMVASSASATALYSGGTKLSAGTEIHVSLTAGTSSGLTTTEGTLLNTCTDSTLKGVVTSAGSATSTAVWKVEAFTWGSCKQTFDTLEAGDLEIHWSSAFNGVLTGKGFKITAFTPFGSCVWTFGAGTTLGTVTGSTTSNATLDINAVVTRETGLCPSSTKWVASYSVTSPKPLHVTAS